MTINRKHIDRVFSQRFSLLDLKMLESYFEDEKLNEETMLVVKEQWEQFKPDPGNQPDLNDVFYKLYYTVDKPLTHEDSSFRSRIFLKMYKIAAILLVGVLIATAVYFSNNSVVRTTNLQMLEIVSHDGFRSQFMLPDGTTGWLGYGSRLKYHVDSKEQRIVDLDGLAFFDVTHQKDHPFIVKTPVNLDIKVLGTQFNVSAYSEAHSCDVVLRSGSVKLDMDNKEIQAMKPNERIVYQQKDNSFEKYAINNIDDFLAWKDGKLVLRNILLKDACIKLGWFYNVDFELQAKGLDHMEIQLTLENETLENALNLLTMMAPVKYKIEERKVQDDKSYSKKKIIIKNK